MTKTEILEAIVKKQDELINCLYKDIYSIISKECRTNTNKLFSKLAELNQQLAECRPIISNDNNTGICGDEGEYWRDEDGSVSLR